MAENPFRLPQRTGQGSDARFGVELQVEGAEQFLALSKALKHAGRGELRKELNRQLRVTAKPLIKETRAVARATLPQRGGLAAQVAREPQRVQVRTGRKTAGVRIVVGRKRGGARMSNRGRLRHPVFGNRERWVTQPVPAGWFDETLKGKERAVRKDVVAVLSTIAEQVVKDARSSS